MNDKISEKMARKLARQVADYTCYEQADQLDAEARCMRAWRAAGLIKPSKLDEAREWVNGAEHFGTSNQAHDRSYHHGISECAEKYEAAITEILEEG